MILVDANILIYAYEKSARQHVAARDWLDAQLNSGARVGLPWPSLLAFLRIVTNPRIVQRPASMNDAWSQVEAWLGCDAAWTPLPGARHTEVLSKLLRDAKVSGNLTSDAHLAALAIEHGLTLCSSDRDFARFAELRWIDPLKA